MIHGDIHNDQVIDQFISVGNPIQHDFSSQAEGTVIILDTETLEWSHIQVDEGHSRFLRMSYTDDPAKEGFSSPLQYYLYKPNIQNAISEEVESDYEWKDISELINKVVESHGLGKIHDEVNLESVIQPIDYNFQLIKLKIHGFRSVVDFELQFKPNERIVFLGKNGSGKSSILTALRGVFDKSRYLNAEQSDLCEGMSIQVTFMYQNKLVTLNKGDEFSLYIDGVEQLYNNKRE